MGPAGKVSWAQFEPCAGGRTDYRWPMRPVLVLLALVSCVHTPAPAPAPEVVPPGVCDKVDSLTRFPKPQGYPSCSIPAMRQTYKDACDAGKFDACHHLGTCLVADAMSVANIKSSRLQTAREVLKVSCAGGLAESCTLRAGAGVELGMKQEATCDDLTRAAQLGDASATMSCMASCLSYGQ